MTVKASTTIKAVEAKAGVYHLYDDFVIRAKTCHEWKLMFLLKPNGAPTSSFPQVFTDKVIRMKYHLNVGRDANQIMLEPNAGGASVVSEALSMEVMHRRFGAVDVVTEMAIHYWFNNWKKIDYIATINGRRTGVSVTRAMGFPTPACFTEDDAVRLSYKKLYGLVVARAGVSRAFSYERSILHCFCQSERIATLMQKAFEQLIIDDQQRGDQESALTGGIAIILTVCSNFDEIFTDDNACIKKN